jgi:hypothetical protein
MIGGGRNADLRALARVLAAQRAALRVGQTAALDEQTAQIDALCRRIEGRPGTPTPTETAQLQALRRAAAEGLRELAATLAGLRDAQTLLAGARAAGETRTYGPQGERLSLTAPSGRLERRS